MPTTVTAKSTSGSATIAFAHATRDADGRCHCDVSLEGRFTGNARLSFHPGESCLFTFLYSAIHDPPFFRDDRYFGVKGSEVSFSLGKHDDEHIGLVAHLKSQEEIGGGLSIHSSLETTLVLTRAQVRQLADGLSTFFGYE
jgi:hypothetical protein